MKASSLISAIKNAISDNTEVMIKYGELEITFRASDIKTKRPARKHVAPEGYVTMQEAAETTGMKLDRIYYAVKSRTVASLKKGAFIYVKEEDIQKICGITLNGQLLETANPDDFLESSDACKLAGVSYNMLGYYARKGALIRYKQSNRVLYRISELKQLAKNLQR